MKAVKQIAFQARRLGGPNLADDFLLLSREISRCSLRSKVWAEFMHWDFLIGKGSVLDGHVPASAQ